MCFHGAIILRTSESVSPHNGLVPQETHPSGTRVQEAILIGLCLSRFGGL